MALTQDRDTKERLNAQGYSFSVEAATLIYAGAQVALDASGYLVPASSIPGIIVIGRAEMQFDNSLGSAGAASAAGALHCDVRRGVFRWDNSASADAITEENIGQHCYAVDDHTVALTSGPGTRSIAGTIFDVDSQGVWVDTRKADAPKKTYLTLNLASVKASDDGIYYIPSPVKGRITNLQTILNAALATGNAAATVKIGATAVTAGLVTMVQAGSAAGQVNSAAPTALNAVDVGSNINVTIGGTNTATAGATLVIEITE